MKGVRERKRFCSRLVLRGTSTAASVARFVCTGSRRFILGFEWKQMAHIPLDLKFEGERFSNGLNIFSALAVRKKSVQMDSKCNVNICGVGTLCVLTLYFFFISYKHISLTRSNSSCMRLVLSLL